jgi:hypothetical protein
VHVTAVPPPQAPLDWHFSPVVQALPSLQVAPVLGTQVPVDAEHGSQTPQAFPQFCQTPLALQTWG